MNKLLGVRDRINKRVATVNRNIKQIDEELAQCKEGRRLKTLMERSRIERSWYKKERDKLNNQISDINRLIYSSEAIKDAQQTLSDLEEAQKELNGMRNKLPHGMMGLVNASNEILESLLGRSHNVPDGDMGGIATDEVASSNFQP